MKDTQIDDIIKRAFNSMRPEYYGLYSQYHAGRCGNKTQYYRGYIMKDKLIKRLLEIVSQYNESPKNLKQYHLGRIHGITDACLYAGIHHIVTYSEDRNTATVKILYVEEGIR